MDDTLHSRRFFIDLFIIGFWLIMMGSLAGRELIPQNISSPQLFFPNALPLLKTWGIYSAKEKIGSYRMRLFLQENNYIWENELRLDFPCGQERIGLGINGTARFSEKKQLEDFRLDFSWGEVVTCLQGTITKDKLLININGIAGERQLVYPWRSGWDILGNGILPWVSKRELNINERWQWEIFNPLTGMKGRVKAEVARATVIFINDNFVNVSLVNLNYQDTNIEFWLDDEGYPLKINTPWGWSLLAEKDEDPEQRYD